MNCARFALKFAPLNCLHPLPVLSFAEFRCIQLTQLMGTISTERSMAARIERRTGCIFYLFFVTPLLPNTEVFLGRYEFRLFDRLYLVFVVPKVRTDFMISSAFFC